MVKRDLVGRCKERGLKLSYMTIYRHGIKVGFLTKNEVGECGFDNDCFEKWLDNMTAKIPDEFMYISDAVNQYDVKYNFIKYHLIKSNVPINKDYNGKKYAKRNVIESIVNEYYKRNSGKEK